MATGDPILIKRIHCLRRAAQPDVLVGFITREGTTDAVFNWQGPIVGWTQLLELPGTDLIYDTVTWRNKIYVADGKHRIFVLTDEMDELDCEAIDKFPVVQYLTVFQDRLIGGGDSRNQAEVEADGGTWPVDSNRDRVLFCEVLDPTQWSPNNFISANTGTGEVISGLGVNSITSSTRGAQSQLVVFKPSATLINDGVLGAADQRLNVVSGVLGCPGYQTITPTPHGLMFCAKTTVCLMRVDAREPEQVGFLIHPVIEAIPESDNFYEDMRVRSAAIFHQNAFKLSIAAAETQLVAPDPGEGEEDDEPVETPIFRNNREWWLDLRPLVFPNEQNWYGPHLGDFIGQYVIFNHDLVGYEYDTLKLWRLDVEGRWGSMSDPTGARVSTLTTSRFRTPDMKEGILDAYGLTGSCATQVTLQEQVSVDRDTAFLNNTFTTPAFLSSKNPHYNIIRPLRRPGHDAQVTLTHSDPSDMVIDTLYIRAKMRRRQSEKQRGSTQT